MRAFLRRYLLRATGLLAGTGVGRTTRKADTAAGFHPATRRTYRPNWPATCDRCRGVGLIGGHGDLRECSDCNGSGLPLDEAAA